MTVGELINLIAGLALEAHEAALPTHTARREEIRSGLALLLEAPTVAGVAPAGEFADMVQQWASGTMETAGQWNWSNTTTPSQDELRTAAPES